MATQLLSPRHLVRRNYANIVQRDDGVSTSDENIVPLSKPGDMQLYTFYKPSLVAGTYHISVSETVTHQSNVGGVSTIEAITPPAPQAFDVIAPQFSINPKDVHSCYPPQGHADQPAILPHIVFNDPHLPWERASSPTYTHDPTDPNILPWLAVLPFDPNGPADSSGLPELRLSPGQLDSATGVYEIANSTVPLTQSNTFAIKMPISSFLQLGSSTSTSSTKVSIPNYATPNPANTDYSNIKDLTTPIDVIFISGKLFRNLFCSRSDPTTIDLDHYKYCSHVRNINTQGMADAGVVDQGLFSIVHSRRSGPTDIAQNTAPRSQVVHLISLEFIADMEVPTTDNELVALVSLYSWSYLCQPPLSVNFVDSMRAIGLQIRDPNQSNLLRQPETILNRILSKVDQALYTDNPPSYQDSKGAPIQAPYKNPTEVALQARIYQRMLNGYTLVRHRLGTGESTIAYNRGVLIPFQQAQSQFLDWPAASTNGQDYMILDPQDGVMDITYSAAWQLGKTMAISDFGFTSALMRVRNALHVDGVTTAAQSRFTMTRTYKDTADVMSSLSTTLSTLHAVGSGANIPRGGDRHFKPAVPDLNSRFTGLASTAHPLIKNGYRAGVQRAAIKISSAFNHPVSRMYDEVITTPGNTDWSLILAWIMDRLYLAGVPGHHLVADPTFLPSECIRFFHVDPVWTDCMIDGALSVANHLSREDDYVRLQIKTRLNEYLSTPIGTGNLAHNPPVPTFGFFLRSSVVTAFPDLRVEIPFSNVDDRTSSTLQGGRPQIIVQRRIAKDTLLCLLDRVPTDSLLAAIKFSQPVHQQCFSVGDFLGPSTVEFMFRKVYRSMESSDSQTQFLHEMGKPHTWTNGDPDSIYDWNSRCIQMNILNSALFDTADGADSLPKNLPDEWGANLGNFKLDSSMTGLQLNDTVCYLQIVNALDTPAPISTPVVTSTAPVIMNTSQSNPLGISLPVPQARFAKIVRPRKEIVVDAPADVAPLAAAVQIPKMRSLHLGPNTHELIQEAKSQRTMLTTEQAKQSGRLGRRAERENGPTAPVKSQPQSLASHTTLLSENNSSRNAPAPLRPPHTNIAVGAHVLMPQVLPRKTLLMPVSSSQRKLTVQTRVNIHQANLNPAYLSLMPQFLPSIFPSTSTYQRAAAGLTQPSFADVNTPYDPDLIFSLPLRGAGSIRADLFLTTIQIRIPVGPATARRGPRDIPGLGLIPDTDMSGLSARMLSNQRWVVHLEPVPPYLFVRLLPRTTRRCVPILENKPSLTFKLNSVPLQGSDSTMAVESKNALGAVTIEVTEFYVQPGPTGIINAQYPGTVQGSPTSLIYLMRQNRWTGA